MAVGLGVAAVTTYAFLVLSARAVGAERYAGLSVLWALVFLAGPGFFMPLEQEVGRALASRRAAGLGGAPVVRRAAVLGTAAGLVLVAVALASGPFVVDELFGGDALLLAALALGLLAHLVAHLARGALAGLGRFRRYGLLLGSEGVVRLAGCAALAALGVERAGPYGLLVALAPLAAVGLSARLGPLSPGPPVRWAELSKALGWLLAASVLAQLLANGGPVAVALLAGDGDDEAAGQFLAALLLARVPLFLFQAVQASLLADLATAVGRGELGRVRHVLRRLLVTVGAVTLAATVGAATLGPSVVRLAFSDSFALGRRTLALLTASIGAYVVALALAQALIAFGAHRRVAGSWLAGAVAFVAAAAVGGDVFLRVELALLLASVASAAVMAAGLATRLQRTAGPARLRLRRPLAAADP